MVQVRCILSCGSPITKKVFFWDTLAQMERQCLLRLFIEPIEWTGKKNRGVIYGHGIGDTSTSPLGGADEDTLESLFVF